MVMYAALYMPNAIRTQVYLTQEQRRSLDRLSRRESRTMAELVREAVDAYLAATQVPPEDALLATFGSLPNIEVPSRDEWDGA